MPPESTETRDLAFDFEDYWIPFPLSIYCHLERLLTYTPVQHLSTSVQYCWKTLEEITSQLAEMIAKILSDPRYRKEDTKPRPKVCLGNLVQIESDALFLLKSCHNALVRSAAPVQLFSRSEQLWFAALTRSAERFAILPVCSPSSFAFVVTDKTSTEFLQVSSSIACGLRRFCRAASSVSEFFPHPVGFTLLEQTRQVRWFLNQFRFSLANEKHLRSLIVSLRFVSHGMPDACRLIRMLETTAT